MSRFSLCGWLERVADAAQGQGESPTSGPSPSEIESQRDREILGEWHKHPGLGPSQVVGQLRRRGVKVSMHTARRVIEEAGYRPPKVKREPHDERFEAVRPNHLWHLDFVHRNINRSSTFTLILIDDCSRYVVGHGVEDAERAELVTGVFEQAIERHGRPERVIRDKGSAFWAWDLTLHCAAHRAWHRSGGCRAQGVERQSRSVQRESTQGAIRRAPILRHR